LRELVSAFHRQTLSAIDQVRTEVEAVSRHQSQLRKENDELKTAKARLAEIQADGLLAFVQKIDALSFKVVCAVLLHGDVAKASRALGMGDSTLRDIIRSWKGRGGPYLGLAELLSSRKGKGVQATVPFNDALLYQNEDVSDRQAVLAEVLEGLLSMTDNNWPDVCAELVLQLKKVGVAP